MCPDRNAREYHLGGWSPILACRQPGSTRSRRPSPRRVEYKVAARWRLPPRASPFPNRAARPGKKSCTGLKRSLDNPSSIRRLLFPLPGRASLARGERADERPLVARLAGPAEVESGPVCPRLEVFAYHGYLRDDRAGRARVAGGRASHAPGDVNDLMPTILEAAVAASPREHGGHAIQPLDGEGLMPALCGGGRGPPFARHGGRTAISGAARNGWPGCRAGGAMTGGQSGRY